MWRALFISIGICCVVLGVECLVIEKATLAASGEHSPSSLLEHAAPAARDVTPPEWAPWSLLSAGAVVILYTFTLPQKVKS
jgi:hypothetical protein